MNDDPFRNLVGDRAYRHSRYSDPTNAPPRRSAKQDPTGNEYMLLEDIRLYALPYGRGTEDGFRVTIEPDHDKTQELILNALPSSPYRHYRLSEAFRGYVESALWHLARGHLYLEIEYFRPADSPASAPVAFQVKILDADLVQRRFGKHYYWVPEPTLEYGKTGWSRERLDPNTLIVVTLPRSARRTLDRAIRAIKVADQGFEVMQEFTLGRHGVDSGFDLNTYRRNTNDLVLRATREIGWAGRGLFTDDLPGPMKAWRSIQFMRFVTRLRELAFHGLQQVIGVAAAKIGFEADLSLSGVVEETDLDQLEKDLREGTRPISEILVPRASK